MPLHDWSRVNSGIFHDFHGAWIQTLKAGLNARLSGDFYALSEQRQDKRIPDLLTLRSTGFEATSEGGAVALAPRPTTRVRSHGDAHAYAARQRRIVVRHASGDDIVAILEIASYGNKSSESAEAKFVGKCVRLLSAGVHVSVIDVAPHPARCPRGIHAAVWGDLSDFPYEPPEGKPFALAAYEADEAVEAYVEPVGLGDVLPDLAVFLESGGCVMAPLEETYLAAFASVPRRWRRVIDPAAA